MGMTSSSHSTEQQRRKIRPIHWNKIMELAFWGTLIWGIVRSAAAYFAFTPYGVRSFSRPFYGASGEESNAGIIVGVLFLFVLIGIATILYTLTLSRMDIWWAGLPYGLAWLVVFGFFYDFNSWSADTLCTELTWFLSLGMFVGVSLVAERFDLE